MRRAAAALMLTLALAACAGPGPRRMRGSHDLRPTADPSAVIAAELAFARAAREKGQWTAFADFAADDAVMFVPEPVRAKDWLKGRANPAQAVNWQPSQVWSSCDGSLAATKGAWQRPDGTAGYFTTVWERQRNGDYKWVMDQGGTLAQPLAAPEMIAATVADCTQPKVPPPLTISATGTARNGTAPDNTLNWEVRVRPDGSRSVEVHYWDGSAWSTAISEQVAAE